MDAPTTWKVWEYCLNRSKIASRLIYILKLKEIGRYVQCEIF